MSHDKNAKQIIIEKIPFTENSRIIHAMMNIIIFNLIEYEQVCLISEEEENER